MHRKRFWLPPAAAVLLVAATAGAAQAGGNLGNGQLVAGSTAQTYTYATSVDYWSVVAVQPSASSDYDLKLLNVGGGELGYSDYGTGLADFVAVDSNTGTEPYQTYYADVTKYSSGAGSYWVQAQYGAKEVAIPPITHQGTTGAGDPDLAFMSVDSDDVVSIADIYLTAGESFWSSTTSATSQLFLLEANPAQSSTFVQGRPAAYSNEHTKVVDNCTLYTAQYTGWHALVMVSNTPPVVTNPVQGIAYALHAYDPTHPSYCAIADFPGPTP